MAAVHELGRPPVEVRLLVAGRPVPKGRPRMGRGGRVYTPQTTRDYEALVAAEWRRAGGRRLPEGPFALYAEFVYARPAAHYRTKARVLRDGTPPCPREDADNTIKAALDALQGLAFTDDKLCAEIHATKRWAADGETAHATLVLRAV